MSEVQAPPKWVIAPKENQGAVTEDAQQKATNKRFPKNMPHMLFSRSPQKS